MSSEYVKKAMDGKNVKLLDNLKLISEMNSNGKNELRIVELTCLMIACIMGQLSTVKQLVELARQKLSAE